MSEDKKDNLIKEACKELGITQRELAEQLNIPSSTMARWVAGDIPNQSQKLIELFVENKNLKNKLENVTKALKILDEAKNF